MSRRLTNERFSNYKGAAARDELMTSRTRRFNILHTVRSLRVDGVVQVILRNVARLDSENFRHHVCSMRADDHMAGEYRAAGIEPIFLGHRGARSTAASIARLGHIMERMDIDLVHANRTLDCALAGMAAKRRGIPMISTLHWLGRIEDHPETASTPLLLRRARMIATVALNRWLATRIVAVSEAVKRSYATLPGFPESRVDVVYPGIDMSVAPIGEDERSRVRRKLGVTDRAPILLNVGRLDVVKGQKHLVPMMLRVRERLPQAKLLIAGEGGLRESLSADIEREGLRDSISLLGMRSDVDDLLAISDLLILSSESEAAPLPLFESMRAGKAVVATAVGGVPELVQNGVTGYVVPRGDPAALAEAVLQILTVPGNAARMGEAAHRLGVERFDISRSARQLERIYLSLLDERRSAVAGTQI